jgi:F0F1-type ATP synthase epsilon subunit
MADDEDKDELKEQPHTNASTGEVIHDTVGVDDRKHPVMAVKVYAPFQVYFEGEAESLTAVNETGPFDILPHHHNFLCMLVPCELVIKTPTETKKIKIARALMHVKSERVTVFVDV